jgi:hypothetical protein
MRLAFATLTIASLTAAAVAHASSDDRSLPYGCSDTVVLATVGDGTHEPVDSTGNLLGNGWFSAPLNVRETVRGEPLPAVLPVRYFAHTPIQETQEFILVLKLTASGYEIQDGELMREQPVLASNCR